MVRNVCQVTSQNPPSPGVEGWPQCAAQAFRRDPRPVDPVHQVEVAHLVLAGRAHVDRVVLEVVHRAAGRDDIAARQDRPVVGDRIEHLGKLRVVDAQQRPFHVGRNLPSANGLSELVRVNPECERVEDEVGYQSARRFGVSCLAGGKSAVGRRPVDSGRFGLREVGVLDVDPRDVAFCWDVIHCGVVDLKQSLTQMKI